MMGGIGSEYISGVLREEDSYLIILNTQKLFESKELQKIIEIQTIKQIAGRAFNTLGKLLWLVTFNTGTSIMYSVHITSIEFKMMCLVFMLIFIIANVLSTFLVPINTVIYYSIFSNS